MKKLFLTSLGVMVCLLAIAALTLAAKEHAKPVVEAYSSRIVPATDRGKGMAGATAAENQRMSIHLYDPVSVYIQEYSTEQEVRDLAQTYRERGDDALEKAMNKIEKGYFRIAGGPAKEIFYVTSSKILNKPAGSEGPVRIIGILAKTGGSLSNEVGWGRYETPHVPHTYSYVELRLDEQGNGTGMMVIYALVTFDEQNRPLIKPVRGQSFQLGDVRLEK